MSSPRAPADDHGEHLDERHPADSLHDFADYLSQYTAEQGWRLLRLVSEVLASTTQVQFEQRAAAFQAAFQAFEDEIREEHQ